MPIFRGFKNQNWHLTFMKWTPGPFSLGLKILALVPGLELWKIGNGLF